jgi:hypothetical protein
MAIQSYGDQGKGEIMSRIDEIKKEAATGNDFDIKFNVQTVLYLLAEIERRDQVIGGLVEALERIHDDCTIWILFYKDRKIDQGVLTAQYIGANVRSRSVSPLAAAEELKKEERK